MKSRSLTQTLTLAVLLAELLCAVLFSAIAITHETHGRRRGFDVMLEGRADSVLGAIQDAEDRDDNVIVDQTELALPHEDAYVVMNAAGNSVGQPPGLSAPMRAALTAPRGNGYFQFQVNGVEYRAVRRPGLRIIDREEQQGGLRRPVIIVYAAPTAHLWHEALEAVSFYVTVSCLLLLATGLILTWALRASLAPLRQLALRAEQVSSSSWDFEVPEGVQQTRELQPIATSIQKLLTGLQGSFERQRRFTGDAAHELKTSLAVLKSGVQLILLRERSPQEYQSDLETVLADTERMEALTSRMLTLARAEEAPLEQCEPADLAQVVTQVAARMQLAAAGSGVTFNLAAASCSPVPLNAHDLELVCSNLLMNAVQHSPPQSVIDVTVTQHGTRAELRIADHGDGIPAAALPHIFERFYRADEARSRRSGGAGLGLAITKAIIDRHGGTITVASTLGQGTEVKVSFPNAARTNLLAPE